MRRLLGLLFVFAFFCECESHSGPFFYVSFRGEEEPAVNNVMKYTLDGDCVGPVLINLNGICNTDSSLQFDGHFRSDPPPNSTQHISDAAAYSCGSICSIRGMSITPYGTLIVSNSHSKNKETRLMEFGDCLTQDAPVDIFLNTFNVPHNLDIDQDYAIWKAKYKGQRLFLRNITQLSKSNPLLDHTYGVIYWDGKKGKMEEEAGTEPRQEAVLTSAQNSNKLLRYTYSGGKFWGTAEFQEKKTSYPTIYKVKSKERTMRGISLDTTRSHLYAAVEDYNTVVILDAYSGEVLHVVNVSFPIHPLYDENEKTGERRLYVSCNDPLDYRVEVYSVKGGDFGSPLKIKNIGTMRYSKMTHPCGMVMYKDVLYVLGQKSRRLTSFDTEKFEKIHNVIHFDDKPEQIIISPF